MARTRDFGIIRQAALLLLIGGALGIGHGLAYGFPKLVPRQSNDTGTCVAPATQDNAALTFISIQDAHPLLGTEGTRFLDVRSHEDYEKGHIPAALLVVNEGGVFDIRQLQSQLGPQSTTLIIYDQGEDNCSLAARLAHQLQSAQTPNIRVLKTGFPGWLNANHPAESGK